MRNPNTSDEFYDRESPRRQPDHFDGEIDVPWPTVANKIELAERQFDAMRSAAVWGDFAKAHLNDMRRSDPRHKEHHAELARHAAIYAATCARIAVSR